MLLGAVPGAAPALAAGERTIAVVVDFGSGQGLPASFSLCVHEPAGATDAQALADAMSARGLPTPTYSSAGLLCTIAGYPATGCGTRAPGGYSYWAYFHGGSHWTYATDGPAERQADPGVPQGWRFEPNGHGNPSDAAPAASAAATVTCPTATATTVPPGAVTTTTSSRTVAEASGSPTTSSSTTTTMTTMTTGTTTLTPAHTTSTQPVHAAGVVRAASPSSPVGTVVAIGALLALLGAGTVLLRRRRA